jgi:hypothetical protein
MLHPSSLQGHDFGTVENMKSPQASFISPIIYACVPASATERIPLSSEASNHRRGIRFMKSSPEKFYDQGMIILLSFCIEFTLTLKSSQSPIHWVSFSGE